MINMMIIIIINIIDINNIIIFLIILLRIAQLLLLIMYIIYTCSVISPADHEERHNLAGDPAYSDVISELKDRVLDILEQEYVVPQDQSYVADFSSMAHPSGTWLPGFCEGLDIII